jgi:hypothetical protein
VFSEVCGDLQCDSSIGEDCSSCPDDCGSCSTHLTFELISIYSLYYQLSVALSPA